MRTASLSFQNPVTTVKAGMWLALLLWLAAYALAVAAEPPATPAAAQSCCKDMMQKQCSGGHAAHGGPADAAKGDAGCSCCGREAATDKGEPGDAAPAQPDAGNGPAKHYHKKQ